MRTGEDLNLRPPEDASASRCSATELPVHDTYLRRGSADKQRFRTSFPAGTQPMAMNWSVYGASLSMIETKGMFAAASLSATARSAPSEGTVRQTA